MSGYGETALVRSLSFLAESQASISHNLANVDSYGYKRKASVATPQSGRFQSMLDMELPTIGFEERTDFSPGSVRTTGDPMHVAIEGDRTQNLFFRVRTSDGADYYTRNGQLQVDEQGRLCTSDGSRYLDASGNEINVTTADGSAPTSLLIEANGTLKDGRDSTRAFGPLGAFQIADPTLLTPVGHGRFLDQKQQTATAVPTNAIKQGHLEQSNVQSLEEMVRMLVVERTFQATSKALTSLSRIQDAFTASLGR